MDKPDLEQFPSTVRAYAAESIEDDADTSQTQFAAPGEPRGKVHDRGVEWRASWDIEHDGVSIATRRHIVALRDAGIPIVLRQTAALGGTREGDVYARTDQDVAESIALELDLGGPDDPREAQVRRCMAIVHHMVPYVKEVRGFIYPTVSQMFDREMLEQVAKRRVLVAPFEYEGLDRMLAHLLGRLGQVWVHCQRNRASLLLAGLDPSRVHVVPHPLVGAHSALAGIGEAKRARPIRGRVALYSIGKFETRKGQDLVLEAFLRTFAPSGPQALATLAVKTSKFGRVRGFKSPEELMSHLLAQPEIAERGWTKDNVGDSVKIVTGFVDDLTSWHQAGDVFVTSAHGEAFDMPAFDAVQAGSRLVHVGFGGSEDYAPTNAIWIPWEREACDPAYRWGPAAQWAGVRWRDVGAAMLAAVTERQRGEAIDLEPYRERTVGRQMRWLLEGLDR